MTFRASSPIRPLASLLCLCLLAVPGGCERPLPPEALIVGLEGNPTNLDPRFATDAHSMRIGSLVYNGLLKVAKDGTLHGDLAKGWLWASPTELVMAIRNDRHFQDGSPIGCNTVKSNLEWVANPANGSPRAAGFEKIQKLLCDGRGWLRIELSEPFAPFLVELTLGIIPTAQLDAGLPTPTGSGPYRVTEWVPDEGLTLQRVADPPDGPPIPEIRFQILPEETSRIQQMQKGRIDLLFNALPNHKLQLLNGNPNLRIITRKGETYSYIGFNLQRPLLSNLKVRRALAMAIDRELILKERLAGLASLAEGLIAPGSPAYAPDIPPTPYDPEAAARLLDEAGYPLGNPEADGKRFTIGYHTSSDAEANVLAEIVKSQWAKIGVKTEIKSFEWGTFFRDVKSGQYDVYSLRWIGIMDPDHLYYVYHSSMVPPKGANRNFYASPEVDRLLEEARAIAGGEERHKRYREAQRILAGDLPVINLFHLDDVAVVSRRVRDLELYPGGRLTGLANARLEVPANPSEEGSR